jgi:hypothetical protein
MGEIAKAVLTCASARERVRLWATPRHIVVVQSESPNLTRYWNQNNDLEGESLVIWAPNWPCRDLTKG